MSTLVVRRVVGPATVQDLGRVGYASQGMPRGGALVRSALEAANAAVGNELGAAAIEISGRLVVAADAPLALADDRGERFDLAPGAELTLEPDPSRRVRYLAVAGGLDVPVVLGSRSTLAVAELGGFEGRALRAGDRVPVGASTTTRASIRPQERTSSSTRTSTKPGGPIRVVEGPDAAVFARVGLQSLTSQAWRVDPRSDRSGTRLSGQAVLRDSNDSFPSSPMVPGAIQVPASGMPIVLGPDGPTTGGYPLIAVVASEDLDRFHALPLGAEARFALF